MLIPSKCQMYTPKWIAYGQRCLSTTILVSFSNGQSHLISLNWKINEKRKPKSWFEISSERVMATEEFEKTTVEELQTIDPKLLHNKKAEDIVSYSTLIPSDELIDILRMAGIIDKTTPVDGMAVVKKHISTVDKWIKKKKTNQADTHIIDWLENQGSIGVQRIPVHHSLFSSNMDISSCKFFR